jgi:hypothetical protein
MVTVGTLVGFLGAMGRNWVRVPWVVEMLEYCRRVVCSQKDVWSRQRVPTRWLMWLMRLTGGGEETRRGLSSWLRQRAQAGSADRSCSIPSSTRSCRSLARVRVCFARTLTHYFYCI